MSEPKLESGHVRATHQGTLLRLTLDRADKRNALTRAMYEDLSRGVTYAAKRDDVHAVLLDAEGEMFCAGNDIGDFAEAAPQTREAGAAGPALSFIRALAALDKPVIAAVQGQATGIGTTMLLHVDLVIAAEDARFFTAFVDLGLVPEAGSSMLLPRLIGRQNANRLLLAGDTLDAQEALRMGLIAYCVPNDQLATRAQELADKLCAKSQASLQYSKQLVREGTQSNDLIGHIKREAERFGERLFSDEVRAIMNHFLQRAKKK